MEECPQHIRLVASEARLVWPEYISTDSAKLGECEFWLISELNSNLIVHHPYRTLLAIQPILSMTQDELHCAWGVVNDSYLTDLLLFYPPHIIALAAVFLSITIKGSTSVMQGAGGVTTSGSVAGFPGSASSSTHQSKTDQVVNWFAKSEVDMESVIDCTQEIMSLYEAWEQFNDKSCKEQITRFVKAQGLDK
jgi:cyclin C